MSTTAYPHAAAVDRGSDGWAVQIARSPADIRTEPVPADWPGPLVHQLAEALTIRLRRDGANEP